MEKYELEDSLKDAIAAASDANKAFDDYTRKLESLWKELGKDP